MPRVNVVRMHATLACLSTLTDMPARMCPWVRLFACSCWFACPPASPLAATNLLAHALACGGQAHYNHLHDMPAP
eukprot:9302377-Alexandrium_andersonii.AAC.1